MDDPAGRAVLFGGGGANGLTNVTAVLNETTGNWTSVPSAGGPTPREDFSVAADPSGGFAVVFGGLVNVSTGRTDAGTWRFWFSNSTWQNVTRPGGPPARDGAAFAVDPADRLGLLWGGENPDFTFGNSSGRVTWNDTWALNLSSLVWQERPVSVAPPPASGASMVFDPVADRFLLFGGCDLTCTARTWSMSPGGNAWTPLAVGGAAPAPRGGATFAYAPALNETLLFGGYTFVGGAPRTLNDTYVLTGGASPSWLYVTNRGAPPSPGRLPAAGYLGNNGCPGLLLVGGARPRSPPPRSSGSWIPARMGAQGAPRGGETRTRALPPMSCASGSPE